MKVLHIDFKITSDELVELLNSNPDCEFVHYKHKSSLNEKDNLITEARKNKNSHKLLIVLANYGFYLYMTRDGDTSSFVQHKRLPTLWNIVKTKKAFYNEDGLVYTFDTEPVGKKKLLVIFSSINDPIYQTSLNRHFTRNFNKISNFIPDDVLIMRIADLGGVTGAYYLNNKYLPNNEENIQSLIKQIKDEYGLEHVVLMGASKGGSGAMYHGLLGSYDFVAVDPIVTDEYYFIKHNDLHFMKNIANITKEQSFLNVLEIRKNLEYENNKVIITSERSQQYKYIEKIILKSYSDFFSVYKNTSLEIKSHPDVAPKSLRKITKLVSTCLQKEKINSRNCYFNDEFPDLNVISVDDFSNSEGNYLPSNWVNVVADYVKNNKRKEAAEYLELFRTNKKDLTDRYYWSYSIQLRVTKQFKKCSDLLDEAEIMFPSSLLIREARSALLFIKEKYEDSFEKLYENYLLGHCKGSNFARLLFSSLIVCDDFVVESICMRKMQEADENYLFYNYLLGNVYGYFLVDPNNLKKQLCDYFSKYKIPTKNIDFLVYRLNEKGSNLSFWTDIPNASYLTLLKLRSQSKDEFFRKIILRCSFILYSKSRYLKSTKIDELIKVIREEFKSNNLFLKWVSRLNSIEKKSLVYLVTLMGDYGLAYVIHNKLKEDIYLLGDKSSREYLSSVSEKIKNSDKDIHSFRKIWDEGNSEWIENLYPYYFKRSPVFIGNVLGDDSFYNYIKGKSIAIVAPADVGTSPGKEIDELDVVIRFNYRGYETLGERELFGTKTNIGYYTAGSIPKDYDEHLFRAMSQLDFVVVTSYSVRHCGWLRKLNNKVRVRYDAYSPNNNPFLLGYGNAVQRTLIDLLRFPYKSIKLFNANFYIEDTVSDNYYARKKQTKMNSIFCFHNVISNFCYVKKIYINNWIDVDSGVKKVLDLSEDEYIYKISENRGSVNLI